MTDISSDQIEGIDDMFAQSTRVRRPPPIREPEQEAEGEAESSGDSRFFNRELSWVDYDERILALAEDKSCPPFERAKFIAIFSRNLDEFFQIRVSGLRAQMTAGVSSTSPDGLSPREQLDAIRGRVEALVARKMKVFENEIRPLLRTGGFHIADWGDLKKGDREELRRVFDERVYPVLTPLAVDSAHPFPYISDLSLNLAVIVRDPKSTIRRFARVKIPALLPRFVKVPGSRRYVPLEQVVAAHLDRLFPGMKIVTHNPFRVTRDAELEVEVDEADDLLATLESLLRTRRRSPEAVRLEVTTSMPRDLKSILLRELNLTRPDVYVIDGLLALGDLWSLTELKRPAPKETRWTGVTPPRLGSVLDEPRDVFAVLRKGDMLVHHPYDRFATTVEAFVDQAADDPDVLAIKQTLYRTSGEGEAPIVLSLMRAAEAGKEVLALVELTARGDEERNIAWARSLEKAGVHVVHGVVGLKTHAKTVLVVRQEGNAIRRYCHVASGNYNPETATTYEDVGLLSADPELTADVSDLFNSLTGYSSTAQYRKILVAPGGLRPRLLELIGEEAAAKDGRIVIKMNSLVDTEMIEALEHAAAAGTEIDLIIRGICCLRPGRKGQSRIRVRSIVGTYLEHSRIFRFGSDARGARYWIGSADLMPRNLDRRVECLAPVTDPALRERLAEILAVNLADDVLAWELRPAGWTRVPTKIGINTHQRLRELADARAQRGQ